VYDFFQIENIKKNLVLILVLVFGTLPVVSALHLASVVHVYSAETREFSEVRTTIGSAVGPASSSRVPNSFQDRASDTCLEVCPLANVSLCSGMLDTGHGAFSVPTGVVFFSTLRPVFQPYAESILFQAPKHSPPLLSA